MVLSIWHNKMNMDGKKNQNMSLWLNKMVLAQHFFHKRLNFIKGIVKHNYNSRFLLSFCLLILCWKVSAEFSRNQIWHIESIIRKTLLFYMKQTRSCFGKGSCRSPCTTFLFLFKKFLLGEKKRDCSLLAQNMVPKHQQQN